MPTFANTLAHQSESSLGTHRGHSLARGALPGAGEERRPHRTGNVTRAWLTQGRASLVENQSCLCGCCWPRTFPAGSPKCPRDKSNFGAGLQCLSLTAFPSRGHSQLSSEGSGLIFLAEVWQDSPGSWLTLSAEGEGGRERSETLNSPCNQQLNLPW